MVERLDDIMISGFIDDELTLDEKIEFARSVRRDDAFFEETVGLLQQEKLLRCPPERGGKRSCHEPHDVDSALPKRRLSRKTMASAASIAAAAVVTFTVFFSGHQAPSAPEITTHRFVLYHPGSARVAVAGSFTDWRTIPMRPVGDSGYWEVTLPLTAGEHRYTFMLEDGTEVPDPTAVRREMDDFGGENSLIVVEGA